MEKKSLLNGSYITATTLALFMLMSMTGQVFAQPFAQNRDLAMNMNVRQSEFGRSTSIVSIRSQQSAEYEESDYDYDGYAVKLENFNGIYANGFTKLGWNTLMEYNLGEFVIERSRDGENYSAIGKVAAFGNTNNFSSYYTFMDISSERGSNFYRLKLMDKDSSFSYSKVIVINTEAREISLLLVFPNPFGRKVQAKIECEKPEKLVIRVINSSGQVIRTQYNDLKPGENIVTVNNVADLPSGPYILEMQASTRTMRTQIMKQ